MARLKKKSKQTKPLKAMGKKPTPRKERVDDKHTLIDDASLVGIKFANWIVPNTYVRVDSKNELVTDNPVCTVLPNGLHVSWGNCGRCAQRVTQCKCSGVLHPQSIEWFYVNQLLADENIDIANGRGLIDSQHPQIRSRGLYWYASKRPGVGGGVGWLDGSTANRPAKPLSKRATFPSNASKPSNRARTLQRPSKAVKQASKAVQRTSTHDHGAAVDFKALDKAAEQDRKTVVEDAMKRLAKQTSGGKPKKGLSKTKPLRKKRK